MNMRGCPAVGFLFLSITCNLALKGPLLEPITGFPGGLAYMAAGMYTSRSFA